MQLIIDRFEGDFAVCENENDDMVNIVRSLIPIDATEGDVLIKTNDCITIDVELTKQRRQKMQNMFMSLFK